MKGKKQDKQIGTDLQTRNSLEASVMEWRDSGGIHDSGLLDISDVLGGRVGLYKALVTAYCERVSGAGQHLVA